MTETVLVVDFGAQYAQLIARRVREAHVYSEIVPHDITAAEIAERRPAALIFSGGPKSVNVEGAPGIDPGVYDLDIPILGICYGAQLIARDLGGTVSNTGRGEYGLCDLTVLGREVLFDHDDAHQSVWMSHFDAIVEPPEGFVVTAASADAPVAALENESRRIFGVQYHPEVAHTPRGQALMERFLYVAAGCSPSWTMDNFIDVAVQQIREQVGGARTICALSGGVDSAVAEDVQERRIHRHDEVQARRVPPQRAGDGGGTAGEADLTGREELPPAARA